LANEAAENSGRHDLTPGRVVRHDGVAVLVATSSGTHQRPVMASVAPVPVVGDWVMVTDDAVLATLERRSLLRRRDPMRDVEQPIVANIDTVLVVCGLDRPVKPGRTQRAVALAGDAGAEPIVVLTKADRSDDAKGEAGRVEGATMGVEVLICSALTGEGIVGLRERCADRTLVLIGESGAGKSRLANVLVGDDVAAVGAVRKGDAKGRHTTTARQLHVLPSGGVLIDTPGIRSIGLWTDAAAVSVAFDDIETLALDCRFSDCAHTGEPGCAVQASVDRGDLPPDRLATWHILTAEADASEIRAEESAQRAAAGRPGRRGRRRR